MPDRRRAPSGYDAPLSAYLQQLDSHGMSHGVLVQPSFLGTDNHYLVDCLRQQPQRLRGIAVVDPAVDAAELDRLAQAGIVGIRLNLVGLPNPDLRGAPWAGLLSQVRRLGWQVEVHQSAGALQGVVDPLLDAGVLVVVDHFGRPAAKLGVDDPGFQYLLERGRSRQVWVKLSGAYRNGSQGAGEATALRAVPLLQSAFGLDRLLWGSDWPHTLFEPETSYTAEREALNRWLPVAADRQRVLADTPAALFGF
jgi:predicted TIM-barrel fold metal-dependent hydrolase